MKGKFGCRKVLIGMMVILTLVSVLSAYDDNRRELMIGAREGRARPQDAGTTAGPAPMPAPNTTPPGSGMPHGNNGSYRGSGGVGNNVYYPPGYVYNPRYYYFQDWFSPNRCSLFFSQLQFRYGEFYPTLFPRVRSNQELFLTKDSVKTALHESMDYADKLTQAFARLEKITQGPAEAAKGNRDTQKEVKALTSTIRDLSSKIRKDTFLSLLDMREDADLIKGMGGRSDQRAEVGKLGELIAQLHKELSSMYNDKSPGVVSVKSYSSPSVRSITKGIEKLTKRIESNKRS